MIKQIYSVLLVDNDNTFAGVFSRHLKKEGITVFSTKSSVEAQKIAKSKKPDMIVTEIQMPDINGFDLIRLLREMPKTAHLEYFVLSNYGDTRIVYDTEFLNSLGIRKYLIKSNHNLAEIAKEVKRAIIDCKQQPLKR